MSSENNRRQGDCSFNNTSLAVKTMVSHATESPIVQASSITTQSTNIETAMVSNHTQSTWKQFFSWCSQRSCDPFSCSLNIILDYLVDLFYKGLEYRTINSHRSAISMIYLPVDGICVGSHPFISRLMKGIFNLRPPCPRYVQTWDVSVALHDLKFLLPASLLSMKNLTLKLVMLMALVSLSRANLLHKLDLRFRVFKRDGVLFTPYHQLENQAELLLH